MDNYCDNMKKGSYIMKKINKNDWIFNQIKLLEVEKSAEIESSKVQSKEVSFKDLQRQGIAISNLVINEKFTGLFGHTTLKLSQRIVPGKQSELPSHSISSGDIIGIYEQNKCSTGKHIATAIIIRTTSIQLTVALDSESETHELLDIDDDAILVIKKLANDVTYKRIKKSLQHLDSCSSAPVEHLIAVLFGEHPPYSPLPHVPSTLCENEKLQLFDKNLDKSQRLAVEFSLCQKDIAIIHGPPGTGKTTTLIEIIRQHVKLGNKVLAVAPSNLAVDNILERLITTGTKVVRMGHPARATPKAQLRSLDALVHSSEDYSLVKDVRSDLNDSVIKLTRSHDKRQRSKLKGEIKNFRKEMKEREIRLAKQILKQCDVILATLTSSGDDGPLRHLNQDFFDITVIDECSQGLEASCYMSVLKSPKLLIAGDHRQLPPTVFSTGEPSRELLISLMERVVGMYGDSVTHMLKIQYRMNSNIMSWASAASYDGELCAHDSVSKHLLSQLPEVVPNEDTENSLVLIDTCGCDFDEISGEELSKGNEGEATVVTSYVKNLIEAGVNPVDIAVITPYNLQVEYIRNLLHKDFPSVEVRSVDGFQGREKEAVILSLVRSNKEGEIGFLSEDRRLNVAVTRARRHLAVVCDTGTVCRHKFIKGLIDHIINNGHVRSAMEYISGEDYTPIHHESNTIISSKKDKKQIKTSQLKSAEEINLDNIKRREKIFIKISNFFSSAKLTLSFEQNLNSFERLLVHEISQEFGLLHNSIGEGDKRYIVVRKPSHEASPIHEKNQQNNEDNEVENRLSSLDIIANSIENEHEENFEQTEEMQNELSASITKTNNFYLENNNKKIVSPNSGNSKTEVKTWEKPKKIKKQKQQTNKDSEKFVIDKRICSICDNRILVQNFELHSVQCERIEKNKRIQKEISKQKERNISLAKKASSGTKTKDEHFNAVVNAFQKDNNTCSFPRCTNKFIPLLQVCHFCRNTFCLNHHQAEVHGCGEQARNHARQNIPKQVRNGVLLPGSGIPSQKSSEENRAQLRKKLEKKIENTSYQRKKTKKEKS